MKGMIFAVIISALVLVACKPNFEKICSSSSGEQMSLAQAVDAASEGCANYTLQPKNAFCNDATGTWWIPVEADKTGCNPACVVPVNSTAAEINWRCTGLQP